MGPKIIAQQEGTEIPLMERIIKGRTLYLPELDAEAFHQNISITVDQAFLSAWREPLSLDPEDVHTDPHKIELVTKRLEVLVRTFCRFISEYKGRAADVLGISEKNGPKDLVTHIDKGIEKLLRLWITRNFPGHKIIGEEGAKDLIGAQDHVWYIDPVDGTLNFVEDNDRDVGLNISLVKNGAPLIAVLGMPNSSRYYVGCSARRHVEKVDLRTGEREAVRYEKNAREVLLGSEYDVTYKESELVRQRKVAAYFHAPKLPQMYFSASTNLASFFERKINVYYQDVIKFWDIMAPASMMHFMDPRSEQFKIKIMLKGNRTYDFFNDYDDHFVAEINRATRDFGCKVGYFLAYDAGLGEHIEDIFTFREEHTI